MRAVRVGADDDFAEFLGGHEAAGRLYGVGELGARWRGRPADLAGRDQDILLLDRRGNVRNGQAQLGQLIRLDPDAHRIFEGAATDDLGLTDAADSRQLIEDIDRGVVGQELLIIGAIRRDQ